MIDRTDPTNRDTVPAMLTPGEFVLNKEAVQLFGPKIEAMNKQGLALRQHENDGGHIGNFNMGGMIPGYNAGGSLPTLPTAVFNNGGQIPGYNWGGWISSLLEPDENSVIGQNLPPAHIRAVPPGYGAEAPVPQPEFVPQAQPGQQVQGGFGAPIPEEFSGAYRPERPPTYITDIPQEGAGAQHDRSTIIPTEASISYLKGEQSGLIPPTQADVIQQQAEQVVPGTDEALLQTSSDYANDIVSQAGTGAPNEKTLLEQFQYPFRSQEVPPADVNAVPPGYGAGVPSITETGNNEEWAQGVFQNPNATPEDVAEAQAIVSGEAEFVPELQEPEYGAVDWNALQGAGFGGSEINEEVEDKVIQEATFEADNAVESAKAQEANLLQQAQAAADAGDFETANKLNQESQGIVAAAEQAKVESVGALEAQYAEGKQARLDAENQWRESQGEDLKDAEGNVVKETKVDPKSPEAKDGIKSIVDKQIADSANDPNANPDVDEAGAKAAAGDVTPQQKSEGTKAVKGAFGDLMDSKEMARAGLIFAAALLTGASPGQALAIAGQGYLKRIDAKESRFEQIALSGKYTPESVQAYKESGDVTTLVSPEVASTFKQTGNFSTRYTKGGRAVDVQEVKDKDGNTFFQDQNGNMISGFATQGLSPKERAQTVKANADVLKPQLKALRETFDKFKTKDGVEGSKTDVLPEIAAGKVAEFFVDEGVDPQEGSSIVEAAYHDMINDRRQDGSRARDIVPYLRQNIVRQRLGNHTQAFVVKPASKDGPAQYVDASKVASLNAGAARYLQSIGAQGTTQSLTNNFYTAALEDWNALDKEEQQLHSKSAGKGENGFFDFTEKWLATRIGG